MTDPLRLLFARADARDACYSADDLAVSTTDELEQLAAAGLLRPIANAAAVVCDACAGDHVEEIVFVEYPPGSELRAYICCPAEGRVAVPLERLRRWEVHWSGLAELTARALDAAGAVGEVVRARVWLLGKTALGGQPFEIFLCRGLTWADGADVIAGAARFQVSARPVVLVAGTVPAAAVWGGQVPLVLSLSVLAEWNGSCLSVDRGRLEHAATKRKPPKHLASTASFPTPPGATWEDVSIVVTDLRLTVEVRGRRKDLSFQEAGFEDKRRGDVPDRHWRFLKLLAVHGGILPSTRQGKQKDLKHKVSELGIRLTNLLHIKGQPFKGASATHRYEAVFKITATEGLRFPSPDGLSWDRVTVEEVRSGTIAVSADTVCPVGVFTRSEDANGPGGWEAAVQPAVLKCEYDLRSLGLANEDDCPNDAGEALLAVLRAGGKVQRVQTDQAMLKLGRQLSDLMQIKGSPFQFSAGQKMWSAVFEAVGPPEPGASRS